MLFKSKFPKIYPKRHTTTYDASCGSTHRSHHVAHGWALVEVATPRTTDVGDPKWNGLTSMFGLD